MRYSVPRRNREFASWPPLGDLTGLVRRNTALKSSYRFTILDLPFACFARECLSDTRDAGRQFAEDVAVESVDFGAPPVIATGHQSEFIHAGVWIKNFLAWRLATLLGGSSVNLIVDNDVPKHLGLVLPVKEGPAARRVEAALAAARPERAFEEYPPLVEDFEGFRSTLLTAADASPLHTEAQDLACRLVRLNGRGRSIGDVIAALRLSYEREMGVANAEVPVSRLASDPAFGVFVASILADAPGFASSYNDALRRYREDHHIRSEVNPMPDLAFDGPLVEAPFWIWRAGESRGRLYTRRFGDEVALYRDGGELSRLSVKDAAAARASWSAMVAAGLKVRPRAITTTIFMRLFVADLFIHGVGGAEYDEVADNLVRAFYGIEPPAFAVITATLTVPWEFGPVPPGRVTELTRRIRDVEYNPQLFIARPSANAAVRELVARKWDLVHSQPEDRDGRRSKWEGIRAINADLKARLGLLEHKAAEELERTRERLSSDGVLFSRDYSAFLLGPQAVADFYNGVFSPLAARPAEATEASAD